MTLRTWPLLGLLVACATAPGGSSVATPPRPPELSAPFGFDRPTLLQAVDFERRWVVACFALEDSDHDGKLEVHIARHGETYGDRTSPFLLLPGAAPEAVDDYFAASRDGRYLAYARDQRLWLLDVENGTRRNLSELGADIGRDTSPVLPHPAIRFSPDGRAAIISRSSVGSKVLLLTLTNDNAPQVVHETPNDVSNVDFVDGKLRVWSLPQGMTDDSLHTTLAPRFCRGAPSSHSTFRSESSPQIVVDVTLPVGGGVMRPRVEAWGSVACVANMPVLVSTPDAKRHLVAASGRHGYAEVGPLRWVVGDHEHCKRED